MSEQYNYRNLLEISDNKFLWTSPFSSCQWSWQLALALGVIKVRNDLRTQPINSHHIGRPMQLNTIPIGVIVLRIFSSFNAVHEIEQKCKNCQSLWQTETSLAKYPSWPKAQQLQTNSAHTEKNANIDCW